MSKIKQTKIPVTLTEDGELQIVTKFKNIQDIFSKPIPKHIQEKVDAEIQIAEDLFDLITQDKPNWKLVREQDELTKHSVDVMWIEFKEDGTFEAKYDEPAIGRSLLMSPFNQFFTWQTTPITEIVKERFDGYIKFKTENSTYELSKIYSEPVGNPI